MKNYFKNKTVFVTGACGTIGAELIRQLLSINPDGPKNIVAVDNNESGVFFEDHININNSRVQYFVADIRYENDLMRKMEGANIVFHCAALKHVVLCERSPEQAILTNIIGVQNIIEAARKNNVETVIFTSSDKAVNPTNVMGTSKLMGERLMTAANSTKKSHGPIFASTRFGNVLGSNGSVIPIFKKQIESGGPVTLTDRRMTRFIMSKEESVKLVIESAKLAKGGEVFVTKMPVVRIEDLAKAMIQELEFKNKAKNKNIKIIEIGVKPGEKLYEELMSIEETQRAIETKEYFSVLPAFRGMYENIVYKYNNTKHKKVNTPYISDDQECLSLTEIRSLLSKYKLLQDD